MSGLHLAARILLLSPAQQAPTSAGPIPTTFPGHCPRVELSWKAPSALEQRHKDSLVDVGVGVVGQNVVLGPEDLHGLLGIFLQLKSNQASQSSKQCFYCYTDTNILIL